MEILHVRLFIVRWEDKRANLNILKSSSTSNQHAIETSSINKHESKTFADFADLLLITVIYQFHD